MKKSVLILLVPLFAGIAKSELPELCSLPREPGHCRMSVVSFFYNNETRRCESFYYGGCAGNENRFSSPLECERQCGSPDMKSSVKGDHCYLPATEGSERCLAYFRKFTFNNATKSCESIVYGGCGATANLYDNRYECLESCVYGTVGYGKSASLLRSAAPEPDKDAVTIVTLKKDEDTDLCDRPPVYKTGRVCSRFTERWTFDKRSNACVEFTYGGCDGSENNFVTKAECEERCPARTDVPAVAASFRRPDFCSLPPVEGGNRRCRAYFPKWTFNNASNHCERVVYGGCGATENLYDTLSECIESCVGGDDSPRGYDVCQLPIEIGPCRAMKPRFGFNKENQRCELFYYGGCEGNDNSFGSVEDCYETCGGNTPDVNELCAGVKCDKHITEFNLARGCIPITRPGECCPRSWDCSFWHGERLSRPNECFYVSPEHPHGKFYAIGQDIEGVGRDGACIRAASCYEGEEGMAEMVVAMASCGFPGYPAGADRSQCVIQYNTTSDCCPESVVCDPEEKKELATCEFEGKTYIEGERMNSNQDKCRACICKPGFNESTSEFCTATKCDYIMDSLKLMRGCVPVEHPTQCCPEDWICPSRDGTGASSEGVNDPSELQIDPPIEEDYEFPDIPIEQPYNSYPPVMPSFVCPPIVGGHVEYEEDSPEAPEILTGTSLPFSGRETRNFTALRPKTSDDCFLPRAIGVCNGYKPRFFFNMVKRKCEYFNYGGDEEIIAGYNVFFTKEDCYKLCSEYALPSSEEVKVACIDDETVKPNRSDPCRSGFLYRYSSEKEICEQFASNFCRKGPNRFYTRTECRSTCLEGEEEESKTEGASPECNLVVKPGNCRSRLSRFFYDKYSGLCREFFYTGCNGNGNNFEELTDCVDKCVPIGKRPRNFELDFETADVCSQPKKVGPCKSAVPAYYYDKSDKSCKLFYYGGCSGNGNRFDTRAACSSTCPESAAEKPPISCLAPADKGPCFGYFSRWAFDAESGACKRFSYGGCKGNSNNFMSELECQFSCISKNTYGDLSNDYLFPPLYDDDVPTIQGDGIPNLTIELGDPCFYDKKVGNCRGSIPRFYFDVEAKSCIRFKYGGCDGNANNFMTKSSCEKKCSRHMEGSSEEDSSEEDSSEEDDKDTSRIPKLSDSGFPQSTDPICFEPIDVGVCKQAIVRYRFNSRSEVCEKFLFGGCGGNSNNFETETDCYLMCKPEEIIQAPPEILRISKTEHCRYGNETYNVGDSLKLNDDACISCTCSSPPDLTCMATQCAAQVVPVNVEGCTPKYDGCCLIGYDCPDSKPCDERVCAMTSFVEPPGMKCEEVKDECCVLAVVCVPDFDE